MSDLHVGTAAVLRGQLRVPRVGAWVADLVLDTATAPTGAVTLASADRAISVRGAVARGGVVDDRAEVTIVAGAGHLGDEAPPLYYRGVPLRLPLGDVLRAVGETLSPTADAALLGRLLDKWARDRAAAGVQLSHLLDAVGGVWRVADDGGVWVGEETWPAADARDVDLIASVPAQDRATVGSPALAWGLRPGTTYRDRRISYVEHTLGPERVRAEVWFERDDASTDRADAAFDALVRHAVRETFFHARYPARVVRQAGDLTLELDPDDASLPDLSGVPIRTPVPGATVKVAAGARVLVAFEAGDPRKPVAEVWESGTLDELAVPAATRIDLGNNPTRGAARLNDTVNGGTLVFVPSPPALTYFGPDVPIPPGTPGAVISLAGLISSASAKVRAE